MDFDDMITVLAGVQGTRIGDGESVLVNLELDSRALFLLNAGSIDNIFRRISAECSAMGCQVMGPGMVGFLGSGEAWLCTAFGGSHAEGMLASAFKDGNDGWAAVQYTTTDVSRAVSIGAGLLNNEMLRHAVVSAYHGKVRKLGSALEDDVISHFSQMEPQDWHRESSFSAASRYVIDWLYKKGWVLYEAMHGESAGRDTIMRGPAQTLKMKVLYLIFPVAHDPSNPKWVAVESRNMADTCQEPAFTAYDGERHRIRGVALDSDCLFLKLEDNMMARIAYTTLEEYVSERISGYDRQAIPAGKNTPGDEMDMAAH